MTQYLQLTNYNSHNLPGASEYETRDLFIQHPTRPSLFQYFGRRDDIIVLANGEKFNPIPFETNMQKHPSLKGALVTGNGRPQAALIVELEDQSDGAPNDQFWDYLWELMQDSNTLVPGQGRVSRDRVLLGQAEKPFARNVKGTIVRALTEQKYQGELEKLYQSLSDSDTSTERPRLGFKRVYEKQAVLQFLREIIATSFSPAKILSETDDFYSHGLDSVQTVEIAKSLRHHLGAQTDIDVSWISPRTIYRHQTLEKLLHLAMSLLQGDPVTGQEDQTTNTRLLDEAVAQCTSDLPGPAKWQTVTPSSREALTIAITGTTGFLGRYILLKLLKLPQVARVICMNRRQDVQHEHYTMLQELDSSIKSNLHKLAFIKINFHEPTLGLTEEDYDLIVEEVDVVIHNAWRLDFGQSIISFEPFLKATRDLINLSVKSERHMQIIFTSSISAVINMAAQDIVPEALVEDPSAALDFGYAQSKLAAERILVLSSRQAGVSVSIFRLCQVGGPSTKGAWADQPWLSALLRTSRTLRCFPSNCAPIDWIPVDTVASVLAECAVSQNHEREQIVNVYPQSPQPWRLLVDLFHEAYGVTKTVPMQEWTEKLRMITDPSVEDLIEMPALKILDYFEALDLRYEQLKFATDRFRTLSKGEEQIVDEILIKDWLQSWDL